MYQGDYIHIEYRWKRVTSNLQLTKNRIEREKNKLFTQGKVIWSISPLEISQINDIDWAKNSVQPIIASILNCRISIFKFEDFNPLNSVLASFHTIRTISSIAFLGLQGVLIQQNFSDATTHSLKTTSTIKSHWLRTDLEHFALPFTIVLLFNSSYL